MNSLNGLETTMENTEELLNKLFDRYQINNGADSLAFLSFALELEMQFELKISDLDIEKIEDREYLLDLINKQKC